MKELIATADDWFCPACDEWCEPCDPDWRMVARGWQHLHRRPHDMRFHDAEYRPPQPWQGDSNGTLSTVQAHSGTTDVSDGTET